MTNEKDKAASVHRKLATVIADRLFTCGDGTKADRLLLVQEDHSGAAQVSNGRYIAGWSRLPVIDVIAAALEATATAKGQTEVPVHRRDCGMPNCFICYEGRHDHEPSRQQFT